MGGALSMRSADEMEDVDDDLVSKQLAVLFLQPVDTEEKRKLALTDSAILAGCRCRGEEKNRRTFA